MLTRGPRDAANATMCAMTSLRSTALALCAALTAGPSLAVDPVHHDVYCYLSEDEKHPVRFELHLYGDTDLRIVLGAVRYGPKRPAIPLVLGKEVSEPVSPGRPDQVDDTWLEIVDGRIAGTYRTQFQGAMVNPMTYTNLRTRKSVEFRLDTSADGPGCGWDR